MALRCNYIYSTTFSESSCFLVLLNKIILTVINKITTTLKYFAKIAYRGIFFYYSWYRYSKSLIWLTPCTILFCPASKSSQHILFYDVFFLSHFRKSFRPTRFFVIQLPRHEHFYGRWTAVTRVSFIFVCRFPSEIFQMRE